MTQHHIHNIHPQTAPGRAHGPGVDRDPAWRAPSVATGDVAQARTLPGLGLEALGLHQKGSPFIRDFFF